MGTNYSPSVIEIQVTWSEHVWCRQERVPPPSASHWCDGGMFNTWQTSTINWHLAPSLAWRSVGLACCGNQLQQRMWKVSRSSHDIATGPLWPRLSIAFIHTHTHTHSRKHTSESSNRLLSLPENQRDRWNYGFKYKPIQSGSDIPKLDVCAEQGKKMKKEVKIVFTFCNTST